MNTERLKTVLNEARHETGKVIIGQAEVIDMALIAIFTANKTPIIESSIVTGISPK